MSEEWGSWIAQVSAHGVTYEVLKKLTDTLSQEEFLHFAEVDNDVMLQFIRTVQEELDINVRQFGNVKDLKRFKILMGLMSFSLKLISTSEGSFYYKVVIGPLLPPIADLIVLHLQELLDSKCKVDKLWCNVVNQFQEIATEAAPQLVNISGLLQSCIDLALSSVDWRSQRQGTLLLIAFFRNKMTHQLISQTLLSSICGVEKKPKSHKKMWKCDRKFSSALQLLITLVQHGLTSKNEEKSSYEVTFAFAANFIETLVSKCECKDPKTDVILSFLESWVKELLILLSSPLWPGARLLFHLIIKKLASGFSKPSNYKLPIIFVRQLPEIVSKMKELEKGLEDLSETFKSKSVSNSIERALIDSFVKYCDENSDDIVGDLKTIYRSLFTRMTEPSHKMKGIIYYDLRDEEATFAAHYLDDNKKTCNALFKYIISGCLSTRKDLKAVAINSLSKVVMEDPRLLLQEKVNDLFLSCIGSATVYGKEALISVIQSFLKMYPDKLSHCVKHLMLVLDDQTPRVRIAVIKMICGTFSESPLPLASNHWELFLRIMTFVEDDDVQLAVVNFFRIIWLESEHYLDILLNIVKLPGIMKCVREILSSLCSQQRVLCQSQSATTGPVETVDDNEKESLVRFTSSLIDRLPSNSSEASGLLLIISKTCPLVLKPFLGVLMSKINETNFAREKTTFIDIIREVLPLCSTEEVQGVVHLVQEELHKYQSLDWDVVTTVAFLKILRNMPTEEINEFYVLPSEHILGTAVADDKTQSKKEVKRALCVIGYLCRDEERQSRLLADFLQNPCYNLTLLSVECQLRLEYIPPSGRAFLEKEVKRILICKADTDLTIAALYFIHCTLYGYKFSIETVDLRQLGQTTTEAVSNLVQNTLEEVLNCTLDEREEVRIRASNVLKLIAESGLVLMPRLLPHIIAMTVDPCLQIRKITGTLLNRASENWDITLFVVQGINLSRTLVINTKEGIIRGFNFDTFTADFSTVYETVQLSTAKRRKLVLYILNEIIHSKSASKALYLTDQLVYSPFKFYDEVLFILSGITKILPFGEVDNNFALRILKRAKWFLTGLFRIGDIKLKNYTPTSKVSMEPIKKHEKMKDYLPTGFLEKLQVDNTVLEEKDSSDSELEEENKSTKTLNAEPNNTVSDEEDNIPLSVIAKMLKTKSMEESRIDHSGDIKTKPEEDLPHKKRQCKERLKALTKRRKKKRERYFRTKPSEGIKTNDRENLLIESSKIQKSDSLVVGAKSTHKKKSKHLKVKLIKLNVRFVPYHVPSQRRKKKDDVPPKEMQ